jgi:hypothetical protein
VREIVFCVLAIVAVGSVAVAQQGDKTPSSREQSTQLDEAPRRLTIAVAVADPDDLKVADGDRIVVGQLIADRTRDSPQERLRQRNRLEAQAKQLNLTLQRLEQSTITPPLPPPQPPAIATPTYLEQTAAIDRAKAEALITAEH